MGALLSAFSRHTRSTSAALGACLILIFLLSGTANHHINNASSSVFRSKVNEVDGFRDFRKSPTCNFTTQDLYVPQDTLCDTRRQLMRAMSDGGRIGFDAPYQTRYCSMKWFTTDEICQIMSKFEYIHLIGDSMIRHLAQAINVFIREDLVNGARATWKKGNPTTLDCSCRTLFDKHRCASDGFAALDTSEIWDNDPDSIKCPNNIALVDFTHSSKEAEDAQIERIKARVKNEPIGPDPPIKKRAPTRPSVFIYGHGGWDDFEMEPTRRWLRTYENVMQDPYRQPSTYSQSVGEWDTPTLLSEGAPKCLFISPNAQGLNKEEFFIYGQNNIKLQHFEREMKSWLTGRGWDFLGMWNATIQSVSVDGTHATMESNLIKAMMVFNWLSTL